MKTLVLISADKELLDDVSTIAQHKNYLVPVSEIIDIDGDGMRWMLKVALKKSSTDVSSFVHDLSRGSVVVI